MRCFGINFKIVFGDDIRNDSLVLNVTKPDINIHFVTLNTGKVIESRPSIAAGRDSSANTIQH